MKKKTNIQTVIRNIVREEVAMAIHEVITELKQPPQLMTGATGEIRKTKPKKKVVEKKDYTSNSVLNDVLNETAQSDEWKTMGGGKFDSSKMNELVGGQYGEMMNNSSTNTDGSLARQMGMNPEDPSADFLKKDYRAVMKAMDKKKGI
tara:strand:+ start:165 stop:608 length:444 start_codon:yes stop_codon:yes gene_type:complete